MQFKQYAEAKQSNLPPSLDAGTILNKIERIEKNTFMLSGKPTDGMRVFADGREYRTSSKVIMEQLTNFFNEHKGEVLENVKVVSPRGKNYLTLESSV